MSYLLLVTEDANFTENIPKSSGTSTREKKNRRKRAAVNPNFGKKPKEVKLDEESKVAYNKYLTRVDQMKKMMSEFFPFSYSCAHFQ